MPRQGGKWQMAMVRRNAFGKKTKTNHNRTQARLSSPHLCFLFFCFVFTVPRFPIFVENRRGNLGGFGVDKLVGKSHKVCNKNNGQNSVNQQLKTTGKLGKQLMKTYEEYSFFQVIFTYLKICLRQKQELREIITEKSKNKKTGISIFSILF